MPSDDEIITPIAIGTTKDSDNNRTPYKKPSDLHTVASDSTELDLASSRENSSRSSEKIVYLIRHGKSEENVLTDKAKKGVSRLSSGQLPSLDEISSTLSVVLSNHSDCKLSELGRQQADDIQGMMNKDHFFDSLSNIQGVAIVSSPLYRAKETRDRVISGLKGVHIDQQPADDSSQQYH